MIKNNNIQQCPPENAIVPNNLQVFRLSNHREMDEIKLMTSIEENPELKSTDPVLQCSFQAVSVSLKKEELAKLKKIKKFKSYDMYIILILTKDSGLVHNDHDFHVNWWPTREFDRNSLVQGLESL